MHLLIDGDSLLYEAATLNQEEAWWDRYTRTSVLNIPKAAATAAASILALVKASGTEHYTVVLGPSNKKLFRTVLWPAYKAHRRRCDTPTGLGKLRDAVMTDFHPNAFMATEDLEADDVLGMLATSPPGDDGEWVVWSPDKDLKQIPGKHLVDGEIVEISQSTADYWHLFQTLTGDTSDGYPGCPGTGPVKAETILHNPVCWGEDNATLQVPLAWQLVARTFEKAKLTEADALLQARVARILRYGEIPGEWTP